MSTPTAKAELLTNMVKMQAALEEVEWCEKEEWKQ